MPVLFRSDVDCLKTLQTESAYAAWFDRQVTRVAKALSKRNASNPRVNPGLKWGHATKIVALFVRDLVLRSEYFSETDVNRLQPWLHVPVDGVVIRRINTLLGETLRFRRIKDIAKRSDFYFVQELMNRPARKVGVPRVWFDDNWSDRQE